MRPTGCDRRMTAVLALSFAAAVCPSAARGQTSRLTGVVRSATDQTVLARAVVTLNLSRLAVSDAEGRFEFSAVDYGTNILAVRRLGFEPLEVLLHVPRDTTVALGIVLTPLPVTLEDVEVTAAGRPVIPHPAREGFYERREAEWGRFLDRADIERLHPSHPDRLLERFPRRFRNPCMPCIDGVRVERSELGTRSLLEILNELVTVDMIEAVEVYAGVADVPARFNVIRGPRCPSPAVMVVRTR